MQSVLSLTKEERRALVSLTRSRVSPAADVKRARLMIMLDDGLSWRSISNRLPCSPDYINRWRRRFDEDRLGGLYARHRGRAPTKNEAKLEARILAWTQNRPDDGSTHWSSRKLGKAVGISHMMVARVWVKHGLRPHRLERYMASNDPKFEVKAADIIGLYLNPPSHAVVFCVDEKTAIQALDRLDPVLPLSPGRAERHGFEYCRRSEEHTSELQSQSNLVCRLLLEKKKNTPSQDSRINAPRPLVMFRPMISTPTQTSIPSLDMINPHLPAIGVSCILSRHFPT